MSKIQYWLLILITVFFTGCEKKVLEPDPQFLKIHFHYGFANELNTFEQTFQKDLGLDGTAITDFWFSTEEQERILVKVETINFFNFSDTVGYNPGVDSIAVIIEPHPGWQFLRAKHENRDKTVYWYDFYNYEDKYSTPLMELTSLIIEIIESKPEYQNLPPAGPMYI